MKSLARARNGDENDEEVFRAEMLQRLDIMIALLLDMPRSEAKVNVTEKIVRLTELGVAPAEVGRILGKPANYVTGALNVRRRRGKEVCGKEV